MGDNIFLGDRDGVRTPMQWSPDRNGGFSRADPAQLYLPPIMDPVYGFEAVNVEAQARNPSSHLNWMRRLIGRAQGAPGVRSRHDQRALSRKPQGAGLLARIRRRGHPVRRQSVALGTARRTESCRLQGAGSDRVAGAQRLPAGRRSSLFHYAAVLWVLLVPAGRGGPRRRCGMPMSVRRFPTC